MAAEIQWGNSKVWLTWFTSVNVIENWPFGMGDYGTRAKEINPYLRSSVDIE